MLASLVKRILGKVLSEYVKGDFDVKLGWLDVIKGRILLENLEIEVEKLKELVENLKLPLPAELDFITIGKILIEVPFYNLGSKPVSILVDSVHIGLNIQIEKEWDANALAGIIERVRDGVIKTKLANALAKLVDPKAENSSDDESEKASAPKPSGALGAYFNDASILHGVIARIIDNVQVELSQVRLSVAIPPAAATYFPDSGSDGWLFCAAFDSLGIVTTDDDWNRHFDSDADFIVRKKVWLNGLRVKLDGIAAGRASKSCPYILQPLDIELRAKFNTAYDVGVEVVGDKMWESFDRARPRVDAKLTISPLRVSADLDELKNINAMLQFFDRYSAWVNRVEALQKVKKVRSAHRIEECTRYFQACLLSSLATKKLGKVKSKSWRLLGMEDVEVSLERALDACYDVSAEEASETANAIFQELYSASDSDDSATEDRAERVSAGED